jgi:hypothetical protein
MSVTLSHTARLEADLQRRAQVAPPPGAASVRFSILTTVYERTDAALFAETAACLRGQTLPLHEWVVLAHGPVPAALDRLLDEYAGDPSFRLMRLPTNLGIMGGMRVCLEAASGDYIVPMDADDLLTVDALQVMAGEIAQRGAPALLYSDEDILIDGVPRSPYQRPDWDPVLNLASSYVWHLCVIHRETALRLALYTDAGASWCHDWDTMFRVSEAGLEPVHVPEVLYHWRQHPASSTNRPDPESGSRRSQRHLLERRLAREPHPGHWRIVDFPVFRGAPEWHVERLPIDPPPVDLIVVGAIDRAAAVPAASRRLTAPASVAAPPRPWYQRWFGLGAAVVPTEVAAANIGALRRALEASSAPRVLVVSEAVEFAGADGWWEAVRLFELFPEVAAVSGYLLDRSGRVVGGAPLVFPNGRVVVPQAGRPADDPGPFAIALKPHCVAGVPTDLFMAERRLLHTVVDALPDEAPLAGLGLRLGLAALADGRRVAFSPLIRATVLGARLDDGPAGALQAALDQALDAGGRGALCGRVLSAAGFLDDAAVGPGARCERPTSRSGRDGT